MRKKKRFTLAYFSNPITPFLGKTISFQAIHDTHVELDANLLWYRGGRLNAPEGFEGQGNRIYQFVDTNHVDGIIISTSGFLSFLKGEEEFEKIIKPLSVLPIVSAGALMSKFPSVVPDSYIDFTTIMDHLIEVHGKKNIAFLRGPENSRTAQDRYKAYLDSLKKHNIPVTSELVSPPLRWNIEDGSTSGRMAVSSFLDERKNNFDAVVAANDRMAIGAYHELERRGIRIPEDVAVTGYDDYTEGRALKSPLTTVPHPQYYIAKKAINLLYDILTGKAVPMVTEAHSQVIFRRSCGCHSRTVRETLEICSDYHSESEAKPDAQLNPNEIAAMVFAECRKRSIEFDEPVLSRIIEAFFQSLREESCDRFIDYFEGVLAECTSEKQAEDWSIILSVIHTLVLTYTPDRNNKFFEGLVHNALTLQGEIKYRLQFQELEKRDYVSRIVHNANQAIASAFSIPQLLDILFRYFIKMEIEEGYISFYDESVTDQSKLKLVLGFKDGKRINTGKKPDVFSTEKLFPECFKDSTRRTGYFIAPLYYHEHHLGIMVLKISQQYTVAYEAIRSQISHTLWAITLLDRHKKTEKELNTKAAELIRSNKELEQFAYIASHDLQEPLRKITTFSERLGMKLQKTEFAYSDDLKRMNRAVVRMQHLISDLLAYSRVSSNESKFQLISLGAVLEDVISDLEPRIHQAGGHVSVKKMPSLEADPVQMRQLFQNLVSNALKFHRPEVPPLVKVSLVSKTDADCELVVEDNGIGIASEYHQRIFRIFERLHPRDEFEGAGIGLSICVKIIERHHGAIRLESVPDEGTKFIIRLPVKQH
ncbi:MAG: substrate-binding domain-containing protein [Spirochaetales bacterium]|nr:substrate-binding domain-containing protein [Spirochaetales bacterium]